MPQTPITVVAQQPSDIAAFVIVIYYKPTRISAYNALFYGFLEVDKVSVTNYASKFTSVNAAFITIPA
jgi:hypothetical protein